MTKSSGPTHVVVDGSNIATEGRSMPSLTQLNDAVLAFMQEHPDATVTVVVDATFGHRIDKSEVAEFDEGVANNELVAPPAGAVGRGDAFVLSIADKAQAMVLSNDSFQEFHGDYEWLFEEGRLIGGKPVPNVGWVFVPRVPVRGPVSRKAVRESKNDDPRRSRRSGRAKSESAAPRKASKASKAASQPMPVPTAPPPRTTKSSRTDKTRQDEASTTQREDTVSEAPTRDGSSFVNELMPFLEFVQHHPVGTSVNATVESYSSHGAYVTIGDVRGYVPLRLMSDPPPRSAREVLTLGDSVTVVVVDFAPARRSIDCALPHMAGDVEPEDPTPVLDAATSATSDPSSGSRDGAEDSGTSAARPAPRRKAAATKAAAPRAGAKKAPARKSPAKKAAATKAPAEETPARKSPARKAAVSKAPAKKAPAKKAPAKKAAVSKAPAKKAPAKKAAAKKAAAKKSPAKKSPARKSPAKKAPAKRTSTG